MIPIISEYRLSLKLTVLIGIVYVQLKKLESKTEIYQQTNEEDGVHKYLEGSIFLHLPAHPHLPHYHLLWGWNNFQHTQAYTKHNSYMPNTKPRKMAQFTCKPATKLFNNIPPNINNLNHNIQAFLRYSFRSAYYAKT
jgi:hypothetical protein